ncbi:MAG: hypothetical protein ACI8RZ_006659, partial [Myxococcota bacterium]
MSSNLHILDQLLLHHPELITLRAGGGTGRSVATAAPSLARVLIGATTESGHPLVDALLTGAAAELSILCGLCRDHLLRTVTTTVSIITYLAAILDRPEEDDAAGDGEPGEAGALGEDDRSGMLEQAFDQVGAQGKMLDELSQMLPDMGWGFGRGHLERALLADMARFTELLKRSDSLKRIADELGRLEQSQRARPSPPRGGRDKVVGVRMGGELAEVLPTELALLGSPASEDLFYQRYVDHRLLSLEFDGAMAGEGRQGGEGPVIACIDTSGSMSGMPEIIAKALVLAVMRRVLPKGRRVRLMLFGGPGDFQDRDIGRGPAAMQHFLDFLSMRFDAGTDFDGPLERALDLLAEERYERADVLLVTDGYARASHAVVERVRSLRQELGFEVVSVVIGGDRRGVSGFSDRVWTIPASEGALGSIDLEEWDG